MIAHPDRLPDHLPPHSIDAERAVLGAVLRDPDVLPVVLSILGSDSFYFDGHQRVFRAFLELERARSPIDLVTLYDQLSSAGDYDDAGGSAYLAEIWESASTGANAEYHAKIVRDAALTRSLIHVCNEVLRDAYDRSQSADELLAGAERAVLAIADTGRSIGELRPVADVLRETLSRIDARIGGEPEGVPTGYADLDNLLGGMRAGQLVVIGARPGGGKTALGLNAAVNAAAASTPVAFYSLEMPASEIGGRLLAMGSGVSMHKLTRGRFLSSVEVESVGRVSYGPLFLDDTPDATASQIAASLRRAVRRYGIGLAVVDYLQLLRPDNPRENRVQQVGLTARILKLAARSCGIPLLCLCQLNRQVEARSDGKPRLSDLRESGEIEQHADAVILLSPQANQSSDSEVWMTDAAVAKNRNGPTGEVTLAYRRPVMRFEDAATGPGY